MCIGVVALHMDPETIMTDHVCLGRLHPIKAEIKVNLLSGNVMPFLKDWVSHVLNVSSSLLSTAATLICTKRVEGETIEVENCDIEGSSCFSNFVEYSLSEYKTFLPD